MKIVVILLLVVLLFSAVMSARANWLAGEAVLNEGGSPYEINPDSEGGLWITDYGAGEIWRVDSDTGGYDLYKLEYPGDPNPPRPSDARRSGDYFWWVDGEVGILGRAKIVDGEYTLWHVPEASGFYGTAVDTSGRLWFTDASNPKFYRLATDSTDQLCTYNLPDGGYTDYIVFHNGFLWLGEFEVNNSFPYDQISHLLRVNIETGAYQSWLLSDNSMPYGLAADDEGDLWFSDFSFISLNEFDSDTNQLTSYELPLGGSPQMIALEGNRVWYDGNNGFIGVLDPAAAGSTVTSITPSNGTLSSGCKEILPSAPDSLFVDSGKFLAWEWFSYPTLVDANGWKIFSMPSGADPQGIAYQDGNIYVVDNYWGKLVKLPVELQSIFLPLIMR